MLGFNHHLLWTDEIQQRPHVSLFLTGAEMMKGNKLVVGLLVGSAEKSLWSLVTSLDYLPGSTAWLAAKNGSP